MDPAIPAVVAGLSSASGSGLYEKGFENNFSFDLPKILRRS